jgi:hypothetical protein
MHFPVVPLGVKKRAARLYAALRREDGEPASQSGDWLGDRRPRTCPANHNISIGQYSVEISDMDQLKAACGAALRPVKIVLFNHVMIVGYL